MPEFALLIDGVFQRTQQFDERPPHIEHKDVAWYPVVREYGEPGEAVEGDAYVIRTIDPATLPAPVPQEISDRQFAHALRIMGVIETHAEAMAFVQTGTIPAALQSAIDAIEDQQQREGAELIIAGATIFRREHALTNQIGAALGWTSKQIDDLFRLAGAL